MLLPFRLIACSLVEELLALKAMVMLLISWALPASREKLQLKLFPRRVGAWLLPWVVQATVLVTVGVRVGVNVGVNVGVFVMVAVLVGVRDGV